MKTYVESLNNKLVDVIRYLEKGIVVIYFQWSIIWIYELSPAV